MGVHSNIKEVVGSFSSEIGVEAPNFNDDGVCYITIDDCVITLEASELDNKLYISAVVCEGDSVHNESVLKAALAGNMFWIETRGATLMYDEATNRIFMCYNENPETLDLESFKNILGNFVECAKEWTEKLQEATKV